MQMLTQALCHRVWKREKFNRQADSLKIGLEKASRSFWYQKIFAAPKFDFLLANMAIIGYPMDSYPIDLYLSKDD